MHKLIFRVSPLDSVQFKVTAYAMTHWPKCTIIFTLIVTGARNNNNKIKKKKNMCAQRNSDQPACIRTVWSVSSLCAQWIAKYLKLLNSDSRKTLIILGGCPGWSESSLAAHVILLILSCSGSYVTWTTSSLFKVAHCPTSSWSTFPVSWTWPKIQIIKQTKTRRTHDYASATFFDRGAKHWNICI